MGGPGPVNCGLALKLEVPWDQTNKKHNFILRLEDQDGKAVLIEGRKVEFSGEFEVGRPPGIPHGVPVDVPLAVNFQALPLPPGGRYVWRLYLNGGSNSEWTLAFNTRNNAA